MSVVGDALNAQISVYMANPDGTSTPVSGALIKFMDNITGREFWTGYTSYAGLGPWVNMSNYGYVAGDVVRAYAAKGGFAEYQTLSLYPDAIVSFKWVLTDEPTPTPRHRIQVNVNTMLPDPSYVGDYWIANPEQIPITEVGLAGVKVLLQKGFRTIVEGITGVSGEFRDILYDDTYSLTLSKEGYQTVTDTFVLSGQDWAKTYMMEPGKPGIELDIKSFFDEYLTIGNIAKSGAVIVLVYAGSKAFKEFKETFKK